MKKKKPTMSPLARLPLLLAMIGLFALGGVVFACGDGRCPCGASTTDSLTEHDPSFGARHEVDGICVCQCGEGPLFARSADGECTLLSGSCEGGESLSCY